MRREFVLRIKCGNDEIQTNDQIAAALREVARKLEEGRHFGKVFDVNGNSVGTYEVKV